MNHKIASVILAVGVVATVAINEAHSDAQYTAANDVYKGTGWQIFTDRGVYSIDQNETYLVTYDSTTARTKLQPMMEKVVVQLQGLGFKIYNTTTVEKIAATGCQPKNHFTLGLKYRPLGSTKGGMSQGLPCYNTNTHDLWSGRVWIDNEYKQLGGKWSLSDKLWKNLFPHEFGHAFGLAHAPAAKNSTGDTPVMTAPNGGFNTTSKYGTFTAWDVAGLKQMVANHG